jgi:hypothetical protein
VSKQEGRGATAFDFSFVCSDPLIAPALRRLLYCKSYVPFSPLFRNLTLKLDYIFVLSVYQGET